MQVSIIVPNYNHGKYLKQRFDSILNQTFKDFEIIILDDNSNDNSKEIIELYRNIPEVSKILINGVNTGSPCLQWYNGIAQAKGEWIWIAESDDWSEVSFLEEMLSLASQFPSAALIYCQSMIIQDQSIFEKTKAELLFECISGRDWIARKMFGECGLINASMAIFRKSAFEEISKTFLEYKQCGDWKMWCELASKGSIVISGKYLNYFRRHNSNTTSRLWLEGHYYSEGSQLAKELIKQYDFSKDELYNGLYKFITLFRKDKSLYNEEKYQELEQSINSIDPETVKKIDKYIKKSNQREKIKSLIKKALPF